MSKILIVEDDQYINDMIYDTLKEDYEIKRAFSGTEALLVYDESIDLVLLDLMLPGKNGDVVLKELTASRKVPIMIISAISDVDQKVNLFEMGAIDYLTKPFSPKELKARIKVHLKDKKKILNDHQLIFQDIIMDLDQHTVICNGILLELSNLEFKLLRVFLEHPKKIFTKDNLYQAVWDYQDTVDDNTLNVHISKLRGKLKEANPNREYIETIWSIGYRLFFLDHLRKN